jgi:hypothetical protein
MSKCYRKLYWRLLNVAALNAAAVCCHSVEKEGGSSWIWSSCHACFTNKIQWVTNCFNPMQTTHWYEGWLTK